jgi:hypothetical protein
VRSVADTMANPPPEPPELIRGMLRRGELMVIGSLRGIGKSWAAMGASVQLASGSGRFLGHHQVLQQANVGYWHGELDPWSAHHRWCLLIDSLGGKMPGDTALVETFEAWRLHVVRLKRPVKVNGQDAHGQVIAAILDDRVEQAIVEHDLGVLVLDPWRVFYAGTEDDSGETEAALSKLRELSLRYGVAFIILHHVVKDAGNLREPEDLWRGSGRLADWASMRVTLLPHYSAADAKKQGMTRKQARRFVDVKYLRRSGETPDDHSMRWNPTTGLWEPWSSGGRPPSPVADSITLVLKLKESGGTCPSTRKAAEAIGVDDETAKKRLEQAESDGVVESFDGPRNATGWRLRLSDATVGG